MSRVLEQASMVSTSRDRGDEKRRRFHRGSREAVYQCTSNFTAGTARRIPSSYEHIYTSRGRMGGAKKHEKDNVRGRRGRLYFQDTIVVH